MSIFIFFWAISPLVLIPLAISLNIKLKAERSKNRQLQSQLEEIYESDRKKAHLTSARHIVKYDPYTGKPIFADELQNQPSIAPTPTPNVSVGNIAENPIQTGVVPNQTTPIPPQQTYHQPQQQPQFQQQPQPSFYPNQNNNYNRQPYGPTPAPQKPTNPLNLLLIIGVILILLAGASFMATGWHVIDNGTKAFTFLSSGIFFFIVSIFAEKKLKIINTAKAFYYLGSFYLPFCILSIGLFNLLGDIFTLINYPVWIIASIAFGLAAFIGAIKYSTKDFVWFFYISLTAFISLFIASLKPGNDGLVLIYSVTTALVVFLSYRFKNKADKMWKIFIDSIDGFVIMNTAVISLILLPLTDASIASIVSLLILAATFLSNIFNKKASVGVFPSILLLAIATFRIIKPTDLQGYAWFASILVVGVILIDQIPFITGTARKVLSIVGISLSGIQVIVLTLPITFSTITLETLLAIAIMLIVVSVMTFWKREKAYEFIQPFVFVFFLIGLTNYLSSDLSNSPILFAILTIPAFLIYQFVPIRSKLTDVLFTVLPLVALLSDFGVHYKMYLRLNDTPLQNRIIPLIIVLIFTGISLFRLWDSSRKKDIFSVCYVWCLQVALALIMYSLSLIVPIQSELLFFIYFTIQVAIFTILKCRKTEFSANLNALLTSSFVFGILLCSISLILIINNLSKDNLYFYPYLWVIFAALVYALWQSLRKGDKYAQWLTISAFIAMTFALVLSVLNYTNRDDNIFLIYGFIILGLFALSLLLKLVKKAEPITHTLAQCFGYLITILTIPLYISNISEQTITISDFVIFINIFTAYFIFCFNKQNFAAIVPTGMFFIHFYTFLRKIAQDTSIHNTIVIMLFLAIAGISFALRTRNHLLNIPKNPHRNNWFLILNIITIIMMQFPAEYYLFYAVFIGLYVLSYYNFTRKPFFNEVVLSIFSFMLVIAFWMQRSFTYTILFVLEINMIPLALYAVAMYFIWRKNPKIAYNTAFVITATIVSILTLDALVSRQLFDPILLGMIALVMLIISFIRKRKAYFLLSLIDIIFVAIYNSANFLSKLEWSVYLFGAGALLIIFASYNEIRKITRKDEEKKTIKDSVNHFFREWK